MTLEAAGAEIVGPFATLAAGLAAAEAELIDGALLDVMLGREEVFPIAEALRGRGIGFVFHSGHGNRAELAAAYPERGVLPETFGADLGGARGQGRGDALRRARRPPPGGSLRPSFPHAVNLCPSPAPGRGSGGAWIRRA